MTITNNYGYNTNVPYTYGVSTTATTSSQTSVNNINVDDILWRFMEGDITALEELRNACINYVQEGQDGEYTIKFFYNNKRYEVHCFTNSQANTNDEATTNNNSTQANNPVNNTIINTTPIVSNTVQNNTTLQNNNNQQVSLNSDAVVDESEKVVETAEVNNVNGVNSHTMTTTDGKIILAEALIEAYTIQIKEKLLNIKEFMDLNGISNLRDLGQILANRFDEYVNVQLYSSGNVLKFVNGDITQEEFEKCIKDAVELACSETYIQQALYENSGTSLKQVDEILEKYTNPTYENLMSLFEYSLAKNFKNNIRTQLDNQGYIDKFLSGEISQYELEVKIYNAVKEYSDKNVKPIYDAFATLPHHAPRPTGDWVETPVPQKELSRETIAESIIKGYIANYTDKLQGNTHGDWLQEYESNLREALKVAVSNFKDGLISESEFIALVEQADSEAVSFDKYPEVQKYLDSVNPATTLFPSLEEVTRERFDRIISPQILNLKAKIEKISQFSGASYMLKEQAKEATLLIDAEMRMLTNNDNKNNSFIKKYINKEFNAEARFRNGEITEDELNMYIKVAIDNFIQMNSSLRYVMKDYTLIYGSEEANTTGAESSKIDIILPEKDEIEKSVNNYITNASTNNTAKNLSQEERRNLAETLIKDAIEDKEDRLCYHDKNLSQSGITSSFSVAVRAELQQYNAVERFISGEITQKEFEMYLYTAMSKKMTSPVFKMYLYTNGEFTGMEEIMHHRELQKNYDVWHKHMEEYWRNYHN